MLLVWIFYAFFPQISTQSFDFVFKNSVIHPSPPVYYKINFECSNFTFLDSKIGNDILYNPKLISGPIHFVLIDLPVFNEQLISWQHLTLKQLLSDNGRKWLTNSELMILNGLGIKWRCFKKCLIATFTTKTVN